MEKTEIVCVQQKRKKKNGEKNEEIVRHSLGVDAAGLTGWWGMNDWTYFM